jgi:hypothetical protein
VGRRGREKDGLWAVLAWLSILAYRNVPHEDLGSKLAKLAPGARRPAPRAPWRGCPGAGKGRPRRRPKLACSGVAEQVLRVCCAHELCCCDILWHAWVKPQIQRFATRACLAVARACVLAAGQPP